MRHPHPIRFRAFIAAAALFVIALPALHAQPSYPTRCGAGIPASERGGYIPLPRGDVFCPLVADPKETRSFASYLREQPEGSQPAIRLATVGVGDAFGLGRWSGARAGDGAQLSLAAGVFAQFDIGTTSYDLLNADYVVGLPLTIRARAFSMRLRVYHQSSHLGDEYLLREPPEKRNRVNLSFESAEMIVSADVNALRLYGGGEYLLRREPTDLERYVAHGGVELRPDARIIPLGPLGGFRLVAATDLKASQEHDWKPSVSARAGFEYDRRGREEVPARRWGVFFEYYTGPSPYGQFFREHVRLIGAGIHFGGY